MNTTDWAAVVDWAKKLSDEQLKKEIARNKDMAQQYLDLAVIYETELKRRNNE